METLQNRVSLSRIQEAVRKIDPLFLNSPQYVCKSLSDALRAKIILKVEIQNPIHCFKGRGTELLVSNLTNEEEVVCASAGNFGQAMGYSCGKKGIQLTVFASTRANSFKVARMHAFGAKVILEGNDFDEAKLAAKSFAKNVRARFVEDSLDIETVEGAGTIGLELVSFPEKLDYLLIALGNGALFTGVANVFKSFYPDTQVIAIQAAGAPAMIESWRTRQLVNHQQVNTIADGIAVRLPIGQVLSDMQGMVDEGILVEDDTIIKGMKLLHQHSGLMVEPSAAVGIAAILENAEKFRNKTIGTIICGGNLTDEQINDWFM